MVNKGDFFTCSYPDPCGPIKNNYGYTKKFIDKIRKVIGEHKKLTLVGQSLGGLRARTYVQQQMDSSEKVTDKVDRLVTIGTPNIGVLKDHGNYDQRDDINGVWQIMLGNAQEGEEDFFGPWSIWCKDANKFCDKDDCNYYGCTNYLFSCGYINDKNREPLAETHETTLHALYIV